MATADLKSPLPEVGRVKHVPRAGKSSKPAFAFRPIHNMWRRGIDKIEVTRVGLPVHGLPAELEGMLACQISDFHVDRDEDLERLEAAVDLINRQRPDFIFLTGDYFSGGATMNRYLAPFKRALKELRSELGVIAIAGNHDHWASFDRIAAALGEAGIEVLANQSRRFSIRGEDLVVVG